MFKPKSFFKVFTETGPLIVLGVTIAILVAIAAPASAQFFNFGGPARPAPRSGGFGGGGWFGSDFFSPFQQQAPSRQHVYQDFSKPPPPEKRDSIPERNVLVLGDAMADWLAYGLEDAYADQPDMGVIRKAKTVFRPDQVSAQGRSGRLDGRSQSHPGDRKARRDRHHARPQRPRRAARTGGGKVRQAGGQEGREEGRQVGYEVRHEADAKTDTKSDAKPDDKQVDTELPQDDADNADAPPLIAPEKSTRSPNGLYEFREERWVELYAKKIEDMIAVVKSKGVPVIWVGLPAIRGTEGNVGHAVPGFALSRRSRQGRHHLCRRLGRLCRRTRRLRAEGARFRRPDPPAATYDGVYFTKHGALKLAHFVEREITRLLAARSGPIALPTEPATPDANAVPGQPAPRPLAGPIVPLVASSVGTDQLLGGPGSRPAAVDALAARTLVKGEALSPPAGRADDFVWPRREVGREQSKGDTPIAAATPTDGSGAAPAAAEVAPTAGLPKAAKKPQPPGQAHAPGLRDFFGLGGNPPPPQRQLAPPQRAARACRGRRASIGRSASVPGFFER